MSDEKEFQCEEAFNVLCGNLIGSGMSRQVFECKLIEDAVVKVESRPWFQNIMENEVWYRIQDTKWARWFAPVRVLSPYGRLLVMDRTMPVSTKELPARIPKFFTDTKRQNWGRLPNGRIVCHDYGSNLLMEEGMSDMLKKAEWYEG